ncbi:MAG: hypothetical protein R2780_00165 [Crocinitomicaceae bacterium]|nr:hypothetical protein [Crocinitomicaceae bacterium]
MKNAFQIISILVIASAILTSCKKGCRDAAATNYDEKAKINDGCVYYSKFQINSVKLVTYPNVNSSAVPWDSGDNADCYMRIMDSGDQILFQSDKYDNVSTEVSWTLNPVITISDLSNYMWIMIRDYDTDYIDSGSELIVKAFFPVSDYISFPGTVSEDGTGKYPDIIELNEGGATIQISVTWQL